MKIRNGFVSNSSSSSFVLFFKQKINNINEINNLIFNSDELKNGFVSNYDDAYPIHTISNSVFDNIKNNIINFSDMIKYLKEEYEYLCEYNVNELDMFFNNSNNYDEFEKLKNEVILVSKKYSDEISLLYKILNNKLEQDENTIRQKINLLYDEKYKKLKEISDKIFIFIEDNLKENYENYDFSIVEYSDNDGDFYSFMEHSGVLDNISLIRISHH